MVRYAMGLSKTPVRTGAGRNFGIAFIGGSDTTIRRSEPEQPKVFDDVQLCGVRPVPCDFRAFSDYIEDMGGFFRQVRPSCANGGEKGREYVVQPLFHSSVAEPAAPVSGLQLLNGGSVLIERVEIRKDNIAFRLAGDIDVQVDIL